MTTGPEHEVARDEATIPFHTGIVGAYLDDLEQQLSGLPDDIRRDIVASVREHIETSDSGVEETLRRLGDPRAIAAEARIEHDPWTTRSSAPAPARGKPLKADLWRLIVAALLSLSGAETIYFVGAIVPVVVLVFVLQAQRWWARTILAVLLAFDLIVLVASIVAWG